MLSSRSFPDECWALSIRTKFAALPGAINPQSRLRIFAVFPSPGDHLACGLSVLDATQPYLAENIHACCCELFEVVFDHSVLDYRRACMNFHPARPERIK